MADFNSTPVDLKPPSDALDFEEYEKLAQPVKATPPVQEPPAKPEKPPAEPADKAGAQTAGESGTPSPTQDKGKKPERKPDAEKRIADLIAKNHELERKFAELQKNGAPQATPPASVKPAEEAKPATPPSADAEPDLEEYFSKYNTEPISKVYARFNRDHFAWLDKQAQAQRAQLERQNQQQALFRDAVAKRPDVPLEAIIGRKDDPSSGISLYTNVQQAVQQQFPNWLDVYYHLHDNPTEYQRIRALTPQDQYFEFGLMARQLKAGPVEAAAPAPEKHSNVRPMVSRLPAPQKTVLAGSMPAPKRSLSEATTFEEAEAIERARTGSGR